MYRVLWLLIWCMGQLLSSLFFPSVGAELTSRTSALNASIVGLRYSHPAGGFFLPQRLPDIFEGLWLQIFTGDWGLQLL
jgi:hypothetical protein